MKPDKSDHSWTSFVFGHLQKNGLPFATKKAIMNLLVEMFYFLCLIFIRSFKWIELQLLKLIKPLLIMKWKRVGETIGVVHCRPNDNREWTQADSERTLSKCPQYKSLIHLKVNDDQFYTRVSNSGSLGLGEAYMDKIWDCQDEDEVTEYIQRILENDLMRYYANPWNKFLEWLELYAFNLQTKKRTFQVGEEHYDLGNDLYELMLDPWMQYTCGYWKNADNLNDAQINKMELIANKLDLKPGMRVLDIGCGWGTLCKFLAERYQVECVGITISKEGALYGQKICKGLPVDIRLQDYRDLNEKFDRIVGVGVLEHVGFRNYRDFFKIVRKCLVDDGIFLCHFIARNHSYPGRSDTFVHKYIFPNGNLPNPVDIAKGTEDLFVIEDWHNIGQDYAKTLLAWRQNFLKSWPQLQDKYDERFYRLWIFYLCIARALFASRRLQLWQLVLSKDGLKREYRAAR